jgi:hypothetical protein
MLSQSGVSGQANSPAGKWSVKEAKVGPVPSKS